MAAAGTTTALCEQSARFHVDLHPCHADAVLAGVQSTLNEQVMRYSEEFQGVVVSYSDVQVLTKQPIIHPFFPYLSVDVQANVLLFRPAPGDLLVGKVNQVGADLISLLVMELFNAAVGAASIRKEFRCNIAEGAWVSKKRPDRRIEVGTRVRFRVTSTKHAGRFFGIDGSLMEVDTGVVQEPVAPPPTGAAATAQPNSQPPPGVLNDVPKKGKKRHRVDAALDTHNTTIIPGAQPSTAEHVASAGAGKGITAHIRSSQDPPAGQLDPALADAVHGDASQPKQKKRKKDKMLATAGPAAAAEVMQEADIGSQKRKKKKDKERKSDLSAPAADDAIGAGQTGAADNLLDSMRQAALNSKSTSTSIQQAAPATAISAPSHAHRLVAAHAPAASAHSPAAATSDHGSPLAKKSKKTKVLVSSSGQAVADSIPPEEPPAKKAQKIRTDQHGSGSGQVLQLAASGAHPHGNGLVNAEPGNGVKHGDEAARKAARNAAKKAARVLAESQVASQEAGIPAKQAAHGNGVVDAEPSNGAGHGDEAARKAARKAAKKAARLLAESQVASQAAVAPAKQAAAAGQELQVISKKKKRDKQLGLPSDN